MTERSRTLRVDLFARERRERSTGTRPLGVRQRLCEEHAARHGRTITADGTIVDSTGTLVARGWMTYWVLHKREIVDDLVRELTRLPDMTAMCRAYDKNPPTIRVRDERDWKKAALADAYDVAQLLRDSEKRAVRGSDPGWRLVTDVIY